MGLLTGMSMYAGAPGMAFMLVWMRLSTQKQLAWYKRSNYQSKDVAHIQKTLTQRMGDKVGSIHSQQALL